eukprot:4538561-Prymnesium_polylepis.1
MMVLMLHQRDRFDCALPYLSRFGASFRIAPDVWRLVNAASDVYRDALRLAAPNASVYRYAELVPPPLLAALKCAFAPGAAFWAETDYSAGSYYSFYYDVADPPSNAVEQLARTLLPHTGRAADVVGCSWWAHTKPHGSSLGHQLHFDTEERTLSATGEVLHPAVTTVTYLSEGGGPTSVDFSSPTVVFDQRVSECTDGAAGARVANVAHPIEDTTLFYPGDRLHCVCPAAPQPSSQSRKRPRDGTHPPGGGGGGTRTARGGGRAASAAGETAPRITLMVSFWTRPVGPKQGPRVGRRVATGVCAAVPPATRTCTWPRTLDTVRELNAAPAEAGAAQACARRLAVPEVARPWQRLPKQTADAAKAAPATDAWNDLTVPEERDMHFFVRSMAELHGCCWRVRGAQRAMDPPCRVGLPESRPRLRREEWAWRRDADELPLCARSLCSLGRVAPHDRY